MVFCNGLTMAIAHSLIFFFSLSSHIAQCASWISYSQVTQMQTETEVESERERRCEGAREEEKEAKRRLQKERAPVSSVCATYICLISSGHGLIMAWS